MAIKVLWITSGEPDSYQNYLDHDHHTVSADPSGALAYLRTQPVDIIVLDAPIEGWSAPEVMLEIRLIRSLVPIIVRDPRGDLSKAVELTKAGAFHVILPDAPDHELKAAVGAALNLQPVRPRVAPAQAPTELASGSLVGNSPQMAELTALIQLVGPRRCTVLISGETGTGKELVARAIHMASPRANLPMIALNCAALPEHLLEAELFGHVRGAYTGAMTNRTGRFEQAHRSTLFLDEIADMPFDLQAKLLRVLQEREIQRLGSSETIRLDVRVIAACNVNLADQVRAGRFREDLYYRIAVVPIHVPPLRARTADIPALVEHFARRVSDTEGLPIKRFSAEALRALIMYDWPGNVRQLENTVEMAVVLSGDRLWIHPADLRLSAVPVASPVQCPSTPVIRVPDQGLDFERTVGGIELNLLEQALRKTNGNKKQAAEMLRLKRTTLAAKLKTLEGLDRAPDYRPDRLDPPMLDRASTLT